MTQESFLFGTRAHPCAASEIASRPALRDASPGCRASHRSVRSLRGGQGVRGWRARSSSWGIEFEARSTERARAGPSHLVLRGASGLSACSFGPNPAPLERFVVSAGRRTSRRGSIGANFPHLVTTRRPSSPPPNRDHRAAAPGPSVRARARPVQLPHRAGDPPRQRIPVSRASSHPPLAPAPRSGRAADRPAPGCARATRARRPRRSDRSARRAARRGRPSPSGGRRSP